MELTYIAAFVQDSQYAAPGLAPDGIIFAGLGQGAIPSDIVMEHSVRQDLFANRHRRNPLPIQQRVSSFLGVVAPEGCRPEFAGPSGLPAITFGAFPLVVRPSRCSTG